MAEIYWATWAERLPNVLMCLSHPGSGLTLSQTGSIVFQIICGLGPEMTGTAPMANVAVALEGV